MTQQFHLYQMKMKEWLIQYLVFSRKERIGVIVLLLLIAAIWLLPEFFGQFGNDRAVLQAAEKIRLNEGDSIQNDLQPTLKVYPLFPFDPNTLEDSGWTKLGLRSKTIGTIRNYINKGGRFRNAKDLSRIYGLRPDELMRLVPYVRIPSTRDFVGLENDRNNHNSSSWKGKRSFSRYNANYSDSYHPGYKISKLDNATNSPPGNSKNSSVYSNHYYSKDRPTQKNRLAPFDINLADTSEWIALPGIGSKLATRIVQFRMKLGGYYDIEQLDEIYGLSDSVFVLIRPFLLLGEVQIKRLPVNTASFDTLNAHPYIQFAEARAIVQFRNQHGPFKTIEDLLKISILNNAWLAKVGPYLQVE